MRRILMVLTVALVMAAMMVATAAPAFASPQHYVPGPAFQGICQAIYNGANLVDTDGRCTGTPA